MSRSSQPTDSSEPTARGYVSLWTVDDVRRSRTVLLGVERPVGRVNRDLGAFITLAILLFFFLHVGGGWH